MKEKMEVVVGRSSEFIDGGRPKCRLEECSFGDLVTDAMAEEMEVDIALINSGAIKGSFEEGMNRFAQGQTLYLNIIPSLSKPNGSAKTLVNLPLAVFLKKERWSFPT